MPRHVPTFKHLLHTSQAPKSEHQTREKSVNELLSSSRQSRLRDPPPHIGLGDAAVEGSGSGSGGVGERAWVPTSDAGSSGSGGIGAGGGGLPDVEDGGVHPAELLRRMNLSNWRASRSVAGPAPPPSWRPTSSSSTTSNPGTDGNAAQSASVASSSRRRDQVVSSSQLANSARLFSSNPTPPTTDDFASSSLSSISASPKNDTRNCANMSLVEFCFRVVLKHLEDETVVYDPEDDRAHLACEPEISPSRVREDREEQKNAVYTLGRVLREQVAYLTTQLKSALLRQASLLPSSDPSRLSDRSILAILSDSPPDLSDESVNHPSSDRTIEGDEFSGPEESQTNGLNGDGDEWDSPDALDGSILIADLPLTLHSSPHSILRQIPITSSVTSLNLAYSTLHPDLERLVAVLPPGLRELGLVGVGFGAVVGKSSTSRSKGGKGSEVDEDALRRAFGSLGRKLIVLKMLDLSYPRFNLTLRIMSSLLQPATTKLPSLRILGLKGYVHGLDRDLLDESSDNVHGRLPGDDRAFDLVSTRPRVERETGTGSGIGVSIDGRTSRCQREREVIRSESHQMQRRTEEAENASDQQVKAKKEVLEIVRSGGRKYVHVVW
ncbi:hypothetical protein I316_04686 [Kwoniella heveanensis BCC8398]|uniref:Uncharacterized protein n=1 Tax=Kwoniella heveanensis BCC8398 TaxID=1296120 RepID=A0A1B9GRG1_9TREE|nr:hypothetical protein I316_04686 [Kwoniella heveanensis BCC8398]